MNNDFNTAVGWFRRATPPFHYFRLTYDAPRARVRARVPKYKICVRCAVTAGRRRRIKRRRHEFPAGPPDGRRRKEYDALRGSYNARPSCIVRRTRESTDGGGFYYSRGKNTKCMIRHRSKTRSSAAFDVDVHDLPFEYRRCRAVRFSRLHMKGTGGKNQKSHFFFNLRTTCFNFKT